MTTQIKSVLVTYFLDLARNADVLYPEELGEMNQSGIDFEVSKLFEYITKNTKCRAPFIMDVTEPEIIKLFNSDDDNIRVSALLSIISMRLPQLQIKSRV